MKSQNIIIEGVIDIETIAWTTFLCGGYYDGKHSKFFWHEKDFFNFLVNLQGHFYAHNGGKFDLVWLALLCSKYQVHFNPQMTGSSIRLLQINKANFHDSYLLYPLNLGALGQLTNRIKGEIEYDKIDQLSHSEVEEYLKMDLEILYHGLNELRDTVKEVGIDLKYTLGATSMNAASTVCPLLIRHELTAGQYRFIRKGYYGGRNEVYKSIFLQSVTSIDRNSSYPAEYRKKFPVGIPRYITNLRKLETPLNGVFHCKVNIPESINLKPAPFRTKNGKLFFPTGQFSAIYTTPEIELIQSVAECQVISGYNYDASDYVLMPFIEKYWKYKNDTRLGRWFKLFLNSLSGKLGETNKRELLKYSREKQPGWKSASYNNLLWTKDIYYLPKNAHPEIAGFINAYARQSLFSMLAESQEICYCDTDSIIAEKPCTRLVGDGLGQWKIDKKGDYFECLAPKVYTVGDSPTGATQDVFKRLQAGKSVRTTKVYLLKETMLNAQKNFTSGIVERTLHRGKWIGNRIRCGENTLAPSITQIRKEII